MRPQVSAKINALLDNITGTPELIKAFKEEDVLQVLYKNGINLSPTEALVLSDVVKETDVTFMADKIDDLRSKWKNISKSL